MKSAIVLISILASFKSFAVVLSDGKTINASTAWATIEQEVKWGRLSVKESEVFFGSGDSSTAVPYSNICLNRAGDFQTKSLYPIFKKVTAHSGKAGEFTLVQVGSELLTTPTTIELPVSNIKHDGNKIIIGTPNYGQTVTYTYPLVGIINVSTVPSVDARRGKGSDVQSIFQTHVTIENCAE